MSGKLKKIVLFYLTLLFLLFVPAAAIVPAVAIVPAAAIVPADSATPSSEEDEAGKTDAVTLIAVAENVIVYIPFRSVIEQLGGIIGYDKSSGSILVVTPNEMKVSHVLGTKSMIINGIPKSFALPSLVENGVAYLPITTLNVILGGSISFDPATNKISIEDTFDNNSGVLQELLKCKDLDHYLPQNLFKYMDYIKNHPDISFDIAAAYVNTRVDASFYSAIQTIKEPESILALCTKNYILPESYIPADLVYLPGTYQMLRKEAADHYTEMRKAARSESIYFSVYSAYRSYSTQKGLYNRYVQMDGTDGADDYSARPGHSEHQAGLAIDITDGGNEDEFYLTKEYRWMTTNAYKYGYILRYPEGYTDITGYMFESWHWRYIGVDAAKIMHDEKITTYEEYCGKYLMNKTLA